MQAPKPSTRLHKALRFAYKAHKKQDRDGEAPLPYLTHAIDVVNRVRYDAVVTDEDVLIAAFLHDVIEETDATLDDIREQFGDRAADLVRQLTREEPSEEARQKLAPDDLWRIRTELLLAEIDQMSPEAKLIKLADRCSNLHNSLTTRSGKKLSQYAEQSKLILCRIDKAISPPLWEEIESLIKKAESTKG